MESFTLLLQDDSQQILWMQRLHRIAQLAHLQGCVVPLAIPVAKVGLFCTEVVMRMGTEMLAPTRAKKATFCSSLSILLRSATVSSLPSSDHTLMLALLSCVSMMTSQFYGKLAVVHQSSKGARISFPFNLLIGTTGGAERGTTCQQEGSCNPAPALAPIAMAAECTGSYCRDILTVRRSRGAEEV